ncbi:hypothetical protein F8M41_020246 [Gigaspora margarita]|uniref:Uncharacterized protein n=1 Tax=Gigaspora margarita TaxID=4874 RepID=A0A8H4B1Y6_GIGMA|nr:hypothetical protein F8M41_020246 [Gigaspora margarita]
MTQNQNNSLIPCRWELLIITNCEGGLYLLGICYFSIILCFTIFFLSLAILVYKTIWNNIPIKRKIEMDPTKGFLIWMALCGILRAVSMLIAAKDWMHDNRIIKSVMVAFGWTFGWIAVATYLVSIFKVLPRLALNQHTVFSIDADLPESHLTANRFIPNIKSVFKIYWTYTIVILIYTLILSILRGYFQGIGERRSFNIAHSLLELGLGISDVLGVVCFIKYGRLIVKLLDESAILIGLADIKNSQRKASFLESYRVHLKKLKIMNFSLLIIVCWCGFFGFFIALMGMTITMYMPLYVTLGAISLDGTAMVLLITLLGIVYGEIHKQYSVQAEEITTSINYSEVNY